MERRNIVTFAEFGPVVWWGTKLGPWELYTAEINGSESSHLGFLLVSSTLNSLYNTSLKAQGALVHRLQRQPKPIHNNAKSCAHPNHRHWV